jgi:hypothetical protein
MAAIALVALISAGCGGGGEKPATQGNPSAETGGAQNAPAGATPSPAELQELLKKRREFAKCVRENGVEDFPDPDANGAIVYNGDDPELKSASEKCDDRPPQDRNPGSGG